MSLAQYRNQTVYSILGVVFFVGGTYSSTSVAVESFTRDSYRDTRMLGRGNAGVADVGGGISAFYNPAGLASDDTFSFIPVDGAFGGNQNIYTSLDEIMGLTSSSQTLSARFAPLLGKPMGLQGTFFQHVAIPGFMFGFYDYFDTNLEYKNPVFPQLDILMRNDWGLVFGGGVKVLPNVKVGVALRYLRRKTINESLSMASVGNLNSSYLATLYKRGEAVALNAGVILDQPLNSKMSMSYGLSVEDIGFTTFRNSNRGPLPLRQAQRVHAGVAYKLATGGSALKVLFDLKDLNNTEMDYSKKVYTGFELGIPAAVIRGGLFQGYWTAGLTITAIPLFDLDITTYGEELAYAAGLSQARYWMLGIRMGLDLTGKQKKKKQRFTLDHL